MKHSLFSFMAGGLMALASVLPQSGEAQIVERERPAEWDQLVPGGRYLDRFEAMPEGTLSADVWGAPEVLPRYVDNGIELPDFSVWGGNILKGNDGLYHLFACGWPESSPRGHMFWKHSTTFHATAKELHGPYVMKNTIGKGHNPEAFVLDDGRIVVYVIDGYYIAQHPEGPWYYGQFQFDNRDRKIIEGLSNLSFCRRQDGSRLMVCRGGGIWISEDGVSPYRQVSDARVYPDVDGRFEDPVIWRDSLQYHLIVNDWLGRIAFYERSLDGIHWIVEPGEAYVPGITRHADGKVEEWFKYERAKVYQDEYGRVTQMNFAVIDTIKWEDLPNDHHSSKNVCIPMNPGLRMEILNDAPVDVRTKRIELLIKAEPGFHPQSDLDIASLRFGSYEEVNYGKGAAVIKSRAQGDDLVVTFAGKLTGIGADEFAPKLLGKRTDGHMVYGYCKMPGVDYKPSILSARAPRLIEGRQAVSMSVENYGLTASEAGTATVSVAGIELGTVELPALAPYGSVKLEFEIPAGVKVDEKTAYDITLKEGQKVAVKHHLAVLIDKSK